MQVATLQSEEVLNSLKGLEHMFASGLSLTNAEDGKNLSLDEEKGLHDRPCFHDQSDITLQESDTHINKSFYLEPESTDQQASCAQKQNSHSTTRRN